MTPNHDKHHLDPCNLTMEKVVQALSTPARVVAPPIYSDAVDQHIYIGGIAGCQTPEEWLQLAVAALDQAGMSVTAQDRCERMLRREMGL